MQWPLAQPSGVPPRGGETAPRCPWKLQVTPQLLRSIAYIVPILVTLSGHHLRVFGAWPSR